MTNLFDYWYCDKFFDKKQIEEINNIVDNNFDYYENEDAQARRFDGTSIKSAKVKIIKYHKVRNILNQAAQNIEFIATHKFGYKMFPIYDTDTVNFNIYSSNNLGNYDWHTDGTRSELVDIKLTCLINLSLQPYEGGKFSLFTGGEQEVQELNTPGNMVMFKSYLNHRVTPVTKGERRSLAIFLTGPKFR